MWFLRFKKSLTTLLLFVSFFSFSNAIVIKTKAHIESKKEVEGKVVGSVVMGNKEIKGVEAIGLWRLTKDKKNIYLTLTHLKKGMEYYTLKSQPTAIKEMKKRQRIPSGTNLILAGENEEEVARILNMKKEDYRKIKGGSSTMGGGGLGNSYSESSSSGFDSNTSGSYSSYARNGSSSGSGSSGSGSSGSGSSGSGSSGSGSSGSGSSGSGSSGSGSSGSGSSGSGSDPFPDYGGSNGGNSSGGSNGGGIVFPPSSGSSGSGSSGSGSSGSGSSGIIVPPTSGDTSGGTNTSTNTETTYSSEYCKSPIRNGNEMILSVIDKDGNCLDIQATRDDTKCEYRYDFNNGVAIKQTQFYYVDRENQTQNIGGCVDLEGEEYQYQLYKDDTKCTLNKTEDKGYAGGMVFEFQTQILFRGADGLIHIARDCGDYAIVQEELLNYRVDDTNKTLYRIVNRFYIDPFTNEKVYIAHGVESPYSFKYREYMCGNWEHDDSNLQSYRRTQIKVFDEIEKQYYDVTGCDFTTEKGKSGKITMGYTKVKEIVSGIANESGDINGTRTFTIKEQLLNTYTDRACNECKSCGACLWGDVKDGCASYTAYKLGELKELVRWTTKVETLNQGIEVTYQRPKQDYEDEGTFYIVGSTRKIINRTLLTVDFNETGMTSDDMKFYEANEGFSNDPSVKGSSEFLEWQKEHYQRGAGNKCLKWSIGNGDVYIQRDGDICKNGAGKNNVTSCTQWNDYLIPTKTKDGRIITNSDELQKETERERKRLINDNAIKKMRDYQERMKKIFSNAS